jgi:hypothetical protein
MIVWFWICLQRIETNDSFDFEIIDRIKNQTIL